MRTSQADYATGPVLELDVPRYTLVLELLLDSPPPHGESGTADFLRPHKRRPELTLSFPRVGGDHALSLHVSPGLLLRLCSHSFILSLSTKSTDATEWA